MPTPPENPSTTPAADPASDAGFDPTARPAADAAVGSAPAFSSDSVPDSASGSRPDSRSGSGAVAAADSRADSAADRGPDARLDSTSDSGSDFGVGSNAGPFGWYRELGVRGRRAFAGAFGGYGLDSFDYQVLPLALPAIAVTFGLSNSVSGLLNTVLLVMSAVGGTLAGMLADRIGRARTLMYTVAGYVLCTVAAGFAPNFETLLVLRALQGLGFGGEWAVGAVLVAEFCSARHRGRTLAVVQSSWAVGWALAVLAQTLVFSVFDDELAWRVLFWTGALPALLVLYVRRRVTDAGPVGRAPAPPSSPSTPDSRGSVAAIWRGPLRRTTVFATLLALGTQGGYYTLSTWVPTFLKTERGLTVVGSGGYLALLIAGAFAGYLTGGLLTDRIGRKRTFLLFAVLSAVLIVGYTSIPAGANTLVLFLGFPLGFTTSAIFSGFGAFLSELYPRELRATGQGFTYNVGRGVGAGFQLLVGVLADRIGVGGGMLVGAAGYAIAALALLGLPETRGTDLRTERSTDVHSG